MSGHTVTRILALPALVFFFLLLLFCFVFVFFYLCAHSRCVLLRLNSSFSRMAAELDFEISCYSDRTKADEDRPYQDD